MSISDYISSIDETIYIHIGKNKQIQPLDPLLCIVKIAMLSYMPEKTKISIHHNKVFLQEPNFYQGVIRWTYGDQKNDIHSLYYPIRRAYELFTSFCEKKSDEDTTIIDDLTKSECDIFKSSLSAELKEIFRLSMKGITKLMTTYDEHPIITRCLSYYNTILSVNNLSFPILRKKKYIKI